MCVNLMVIPTRAKKCKYVQIEKKMAIKKRKRKKTEIINDYRCR